MNTSTAVLFRAKIIEPAQSRLFPADRPRPVFISQLLHERPFAELRAGHEWHIGNVNEEEPGALIFAVGRTTKTNRDQFDETTGNFVASEQEEAPFTHAFLDLELGVLALVPKARLSPKPSGIARALARMLNQQETVAREGIRIEVAEIWDPEDFIAHLKGAHAIERFTAEVSRPNPWDVEQDFHKPFQRYVEATDATSGKAIVEGEDLDRERIENIARSVASTGNDASAKVRDKPGDRAITRHLRGDSARVPLPDGFENKALEVFARVRAAYRRIRERGGGE